MAISGDLVMLTLLFQTHGLDTSLININTILFGQRIFMAGNGNIIVNEKRVPI